MPQYKEVQQAASSGQHAAEGKTCLTPCPTCPELVEGCSMPYAYPYPLLPDALNACAYPTQLLFQPFVAPVEVVNSGYLGNAFGGQPCQDQRGTGPQIRGHHRGALQF